MGNYLPQCKEAPNQNSDSESSNSPSLIKSRTMAETELIEIAHWAILSMKVPGYLFFTLESRPSELILRFENTPKFALPSKAMLSQKGIEETLKETVGFETLGLQSLFQLNTYSVYAFFCCFGSFMLTLFSIYKGFQVLIEFGDEAGRQDIFSDNSDRLMGVSNLVIMAALSLIFRFIFLRNKKKSLKFWKSVTKLYEEFRKNLQCSANCFQKVQRESKKDAIWLWTIAILQTFILLIFTLLLQVHDKIPDIGLTSTVLWFICITIINIHVGLTIWVGFYIRFYSACFKAVQQEVKRFSFKEEEREDQLLTIRFKDGLFEFHKRQVLENLLNHFELAYEAVEKFNHYYSFAIIVDMMIGLINSLAAAYQINKLTYESGKPWIMNLPSLMAIPFHCLYAVRIFYLVGSSEKVTEEGLGVLRSLQLIKSNCFFAVDRNNKEENSFLLAKMQMLVTRVSLNPPSISPGNYLRLSRRLLASIVSIIATYFIVLTELREEDEGRRLIRSLLNHTCFTQKSIV